MTGIPNFLRYLYYLVPPPYGTRHILSVVWSFGVNKRRSAYCLQMFWWTF